MFSRKKILSFHEFLNQLNQGLFFIIFFRHNGICKTIVRIRKMQLQKNSDLIVN